MRKLSDGILPCGRCGGTIKFGELYSSAFNAECHDCGLHTKWKWTVVDTIAAWNTLSAATHPEPEDYLELLEECKPPLLGRPDTPAMWNHLNLMFNLQDDYGDDDD